MLGSYLIHGMLLHDAYASLPNLFRSDTDAQHYMPIMLLAHVIMAGAFVWIFARGVERRPWPGQGLRFGGMIALFTVVPTYLIYFVVQPMPGACVIRQIAFDSVLLLILGETVAFLYRPQPQS